MGVREHEKRVPHPETGQILVREAYFMSFYSYKNAQSGCCPGAVTAAAAMDGIKEKVCIQVKRVYDSCLQQKQLKDKDDEYAAREADRAFHELVSAAIKDAGGRNDKAIMALLDMEALKDSKNQKDDIKAALEGLQKDSDYLFGSKEPIQNPTGPTNSSHSEGEDSALRAAMGLPPVKD